MSASTCTFSPHQDLLLCDSYLCSSLDRSHCFFPWLVVWDGDEGHWASVSVSWVPISAPIRAKTSCPFIFFCRSIDVQQRTPVFSKSQYVCFTDSWEVETVWETESNATPPQCVFSGWGCMFHTHRHTQHTLTIKYSFHKEPAVRSAPISKGNFNVHNVLNHPDGHPIKFHILLPSRVISGGNRWPELLATSSQCSLSVCLWTAVCVMNIHVHTGLCVVIGRWQRSCRADQWAARRRSCCTFWHHHISRYTAGSEVALGSVTLPSFQSEIPSGIWFLPEPFLSRQAVLSVHDTVAQKNFDPVLPPLPDDFEEELEEESVKIVRLVKNKEPLVSCDDDIGEVKMDPDLCSFLLNSLLSCLCSRAPPSGGMTPLVWW